MPSEAKRLRQLEDENAKLKRIVADLSLDKAMLHDVLQESSEALPAVASLWIRCGKSGRHRCAGLVKSCAPTVHSTPTSPGAGSRPP